MKITDFLAKSKGTTLVNHTKAVANYSKILFEKLYDGFDSDKMLKRCIQAAVLHDIGKLTDEFQQELNNDAYNMTERHNVISWAFAKCNGFDDIVSSMVLFHHVPSIMNTDASAIACDIYCSLSDAEICRMNAFYLYMQEIYLEYLPSLRPKDDMSDYTTEALFNVSTQNTNVAKDMLLLRSILVKADRDISSVEYFNQQIADNDEEYVNDIIERDGALYIDDESVKEALEQNYDMNRLKVQMDIVEQCSAAMKEGKNTVQINASAGFGKTLVGLLSIFNRKKKTVWCVPTREIAMSTYESICKELKKINVPLSVVLYYGNEIQKRFNNDSDSIDEYSIVVSVIDSMLSRMTNNNMGHLLYSLMSNDVIFDEYHNVVTDTALFAAASLLWENRILNTKSYSMFLSATPLNLRCAGLTSMENVVEINPPKYRGDIRIEFHYQQIADMKTDMPDVLPNSFVIANTVSQAQTIYRYLKVEKKMTNVFLYHAQYEEQDMVAKRKILFDNFGKNTPESNLIVVCTGIIGTGLDVSAKNIYDFTLTPSDTLQRVCGRASRFGEYDTISYFLCDVAKSEPVMGRGTVAFIDNVFSTSIRARFIEIMKKHDGTTFTKNDLYSIINDFSEKEKINFYSFYKDKLGESRKHLKEISLKKASKKNDNGPKFTSKKTSFRGNGTEIFISVHKEDDTGYAIFTYDSDRVERIEKEPDSTDFRKYRWQYYKKNVSEKERKSWKYKFGMKDYNTCNFDTCVSMAYCSETPLPVVNLTYSHEYGVEKKKEEK